MADQVPASLEIGTRIKKAGHSCYSAPRDHSFKPHPGIATTAADCEGGFCEGDGQQASAAAAAAAIAASSGDQRITASTLFAYRAMNTRERGYGARLYHKVAQTNEDSCLEMETRYKDVSQRIVRRSSGKKTENYHTSTPQETSVHGHDPMQDSLLCEPRDGTRDAASAAFTHKYDISDDEGNSSGRISPRTFRLWATGLSSQEVASERHHACFHACMGSLDDGVATMAAQPGLTDDDSAWSSDSESTAPARSKWEHILEWQNKMANPIPDDSSLSPFRAPGQVITIKNHDILSALSHPSAPPLLANVPPSHLHSALRLRHQLLLDSHQAETRMTELKTEVQARIDHHLTRTREEALPANAESDKQDREQGCREEIYRHVEGYLGDLTNLYLASQERLRALADEVDGLMTREHMFRQGIC
ncbi:hypothetical protein E4U21_002744 [Claviceps maximensis]|nr:hypothetical protein E4U21_002744 [Claviceps maximensis]